MQHLELIASLLKSEDFVSALDQNLVVTSHFLRLYHESKDLIGTSNCGPKDKLIAENIAILFILKYPEYVLKLRDRDLNLTEIGCCCMYLLGANIKEIGEIINRSPSRYNLNSTIRKKLGITQGRLFEILIREFQEMYGKGELIKYNNSK